MAGARVPQRLQGAVAASRNCTRPMLSPLFPIN